MSNNPSEIPRGNTINTFVIAVLLTPTAVPSVPLAEQTFTVKGLHLGDFIDGNKPSFQQGLAVSGYRVSAVDTVAVTYVNSSGGSITPTAETYTFFVARPVNLNAAGTASALSAAP
jgi:hypothetical protein